MPKVDPADASSGFWIPVTLCVAAFIVITACGVSLLPSALWAAGVGTAAAVVQRCVRRNLFVGRATRHEDE
jgi:hypothetical protein